MTAFLADAVVTLHALAVAFIVGLPPCVLVGRWRGWRWIRDPWLRGLHLGLVAYLVVSAAIGEWCFLTYLEQDLRRHAEQFVRADRSFVGRLLHDLLFVDASATTLQALYFAFGVLVLVVTVAVPPARAPGEE